MWGLLSHKLSLGVDFRIRTRKRLLFTVPDYDGGQLFRNS